MSDHALGRKLVQNAALIFSATIATKVFTSIGQLVLGALLLEESFALYAWTLALYDGLALAQKLGFREIFSRRYDELDTLTRACAWMSLGTGILAGVLMAVLAMPLAQAYDAPELAGLLWVAALGAPLRGLSVVSGAALAARMKFGLLSVVTVVQGLVQIGLSVGLAASGLGAYALVIPLPVVALLGLAITWWPAQIRFAGGPDFRIWPGVFKASGFLFATNMLYSMVRQGDYLILGFFLVKASVGVYFFAFSLSTQVATLLAGNLATVLTPGLGRLKHDMGRQVRAFIEAGAAMGYVAMPASVLLAVCADPLLRLLYGEKWVAAIVPLQILSFAAGVAAVGWLGTAIYAAMGKFRLQFLMAIMGASTFLGVITLAATTGDLAVVCIAVLVQRLLVTGVSISLVTDSWRNGTWFVMAIVRPTMLAVACALPAIVAQVLTGPDRSGMANVGIIALTGASLGLLYHPLGKVVLKQTATSFGKRIRDAMPQKFQRYSIVRLGMRFL